MGRGGSRKYIPCRIVNDFLGPWEAFLASFGSSFALLKPCLWSKFAFLSNAIEFSRENSVPRLSRNSFLPKKHENKTFRTLKNLKKPRFFKVFQGFTVFAFWHMLQVFFLQNGAQGVILAPQKSHKVTQRAPKRCLGRPSGTTGGVLLLPLSHLEGPQTPSLTLHGGSEAQFYCFG